MQEHYSHAYSRGIHATRSLFLDFYMFSYLQGEKYDNKLPLKRGP